MSQSAAIVTFKRRNITPAVSRFAFGFDCPPQWNQLEIPSDTPDFSEPATFMPLAVFMSPLAAILYTVAARPKFEDGSVMEWAQFLMAQHQMQVTQLMPGNINGYPAIRAMATQASDAGPMQVAVAFFEDGGSLIQVSGMAPQELWGSMEATFEHMINSFTLAQPQGATVGLIPGQEPQINETTFAQLALEETSDTLTNEDHPVNAQLRDRGIGLLPRALQVNEEGRFALMGCGAIMAAVPVPFGWHIFDDGRRALVLTADNAIQINLNLQATSGYTIDQGMDQIIAGVLEEQPQVEHHKLDLEGTPTLAFKGLKIGDEVLSQVFMFRETGREGFVLQMRVTCEDAKLYRTMDLAGLILKEMKFFED